MPDSGNVAKGLRERLGGNPDDRLGRALSDLLESPLLASAVGRAFDAREKATAAQEVAFGALNIPSAADIERLTRRLRSVSHRLEGIEDGVDRLDRALTPSGVEARLSAIEAHLRTLTEHLEQALRAPAGVSGSGSAQSAAGAAKGAGPAPAAAAAGAAPRAASGASPAPSKPARKGASPRAAAKPAKRAGARKAEQTKRTAAAKAAKRAKTSQGSRRARPAA